MVLLANLLTDIAYAVDGSAGHATTDGHDRPVPTIGTSSEATSPRRRVARRAGRVRRFLRHRLAVLGLVIIIVLIILAIVGIEAAALKQNLAHANEPPSPSSSGSGPIATAVTCSHGRSSAAASR